jgi:hypothetical protein
VNNYITKIYVTANTVHASCYHLICLGGPGYSHISTVFVIDYTLVQRDCFTLLNTTALMAEIVKYKEINIGNLATIKVCKRNIFWEI